ncbi:MAG: FkbM family methyltransferase, partial [Cyanothece sp. SIO2G6]|nr:FkbM family methyltransferase [Cyanothece sp. SIO2G6]
MNESRSNADYYLKYLNEAKADVDLSRIRDLCDRTHWDEPESPLDFNNLSVVALVIAATSDNMEVEGQFYLEMALDALSNNAHAHPLCATHLALVQLLMGDTLEAGELAFSTLINLSLLPPNMSSTLEPGLVYIPAAKAAHIAGQAEALEHLHNCSTGSEQAIALCAEVLWRSQLVFYNTNGLRFLQVAAKSMPDSSLLNLALGISNIFNRQWEGLSYLHRALQLNPDYAPTHQSLFLACKALGNEGLATEWLTVAKEKAQAHPNDKSWQWTTLPHDSSFSYMPFGSLVMAVEAKIHSIVTSVLLVEGDWFEAEMEFWRKQLHPGMTVIDVGANAGAYTFSAAEKVGSSGRVLAVEPFPDCVQCLEETQRINNLEWVIVCAGAASDRIGTATLAVQGSSELNEIVTDEIARNRDNVQTVECFTLDSLVEKHKLTRVDWLKIDAEGHEMQVLKGGDRLLSKFSPGILYENIAGA